MMWYYLLDSRYTWDKPRLSENLDVIKFLCKEFWSKVFQKQIDNLKTNHRVMPIIKY